MEETEVKTIRVDKDQHQMDATVVSAFLIISWGDPELKEPN